MGQVHVLWGFPFKTNKKNEIMNKKLELRPQKGQPGTGEAPAAFAFS